MKLAPIIHQQIVQLRWQLLACLGLMMALPLEDAIANLWQGNGFYAGSLSLAVPLVASPLLAALLACANVQADFDERRYTFWRSKPAGITSWVLLKYVIGLLAAFAVIALPFLFAFITCKLVQPNEIEKAFFETVVMVQSVSLLTYSLCFLCNVLIRKTARAWLVGMALTGFLMIVPFVLPLNLRTIDDVFDLLGRKWSFIWVGYCLTGIPSLAALSLSIVAAARNWHVRTNFKGLLWTAAGLALSLMLLFSRQIANIKVLDEIDIPRDYRYIAGNQLLYSETPNRKALKIETEAGKIELNEINTTPSEETLRQEKEAPRLYPSHPGLGLDIYPHFDRITFDTGTDTFLFTLRIAYDREQITKSVYREKLKYAYLCGYRLLEGFYPVSVSMLDLSDCVDQEVPRKAAVRRIGDKLVVLIQDSIAVAQIKADGGLELVEKENGGLKGYSRNLASRDKTFKIPLVPINMFTAKERIKLTLDVQDRYYNTWSWQQEEYFSRYSLVDIHDDKISFCLLDEKEICRFDVVNWDDEYIYCRMRDARSFTFLEQMFSQVSSYYPAFAKDGKLYAPANKKLMVFDIRSDRIRKLGHFERLSEHFSVDDIKVLENGNILMSAEAGYTTYEDGQRRPIYDLYLLQNPD